MLNLRKIKSFNPIKYLSLILTITFILIFQTGRTQDIYLKSVVKKRIQPPIVTLTEDYYYDNNWQLDSVIYTWQSGNTTNYYYSGDSIINIKFSNGDLIQYIYFEDSVVRYNTTLNEVFEVHHIDDENKEIRNDYYANGVYNWTAFNTWENGNRTHLTSTTGWYQDYTFYENLLNPKFKRYRFLKEGNFDRGCINYISYSDGQEPWEYELFIVEDSLNSYPTLVTTYVMGEPSDEYTYDYYIVVDIPENDILKEKIISIKYFNLIGQEIDKPESGFYIEMKQTTEGLSSRKIFQTKY